MLKNKKNFLQRYTGTFGHLLSRFFENEGPGRLEMVQCKFCSLSRTRNIIAGKFVKIVGFLIALLEYVFCMLNELRFVLK